MCLLSYIVSTYDSESYEPLCGKEWQSRYHKLHDSIMTGTSDPKYFISVPVKAGLADNMFGYVSGFLWSLMTDRAFLILHDPNLQGCQQRTIEFAYESNSIDWRSPLINQSHYGCLLPPYNKLGHGSGNCSNETINFNGHFHMTVRRIRSVNVISSAFTEHNLTTVLHDRNIILFANNRGVTYNMFNHPLYKDKLTQMGFKKETMFSCLYQFLFKIKKDICTGNCKATENMLMEAGREGSNTIRIGIQSRNPLHTNATYHMNCAQELAQHYESQGKKVLYLLITSNLDLQKNLKREYGEKLLLPEREASEVTPLDDTGLLDDGVHCNAHIAKDKRAMIQSARDTYLFSMTDIQIVSSRSGFGLFGAMMRPHSHPLIYRIDGARTCADRLEGDDLQDIANEWSGL